MSVISVERSRPASRNVLSKQIAAARTPLNLPPVIGHDQIAARARQIWQESGCPHGCDEQNWLRAEQELKEEVHLL